MNIALIDNGHNFGGGKLPNLALMKLSAYHKLNGDNVFLNPTNPKSIDRTYVSIVFTKDKEPALATYGNWPNVHFGGTGFSLSVVLPDEIERTLPDYNLYATADIYERIRNRVSKKENVYKKAQEIVDAGVGFIFRGCVNSEKTCGWCCVPKKEGKMSRVTSNISDLLNPRSRRLVLLDNSPLAHHDSLDVLKEMAERKIIVDITQGFDIRRLTPEIAMALSKVRHWRSLHYSWDIVKSEQSVFNGIGMLSDFIARSRQLCFLLCGFNTTFEEDMERVKKLHDAQIRPYIMVYQPLKDFKDPSVKNSYDKVKLGHFKRWVNAPAGLYKTVPFGEYTNWMNAQAKMAGAHGAAQLSFDLAA